MKTMKKAIMSRRSWIAVALVAVAILTTVGLVIGCRPVVGHPDEQGIPGYVRVNFGYDNGRTVLPWDSTILDFTVINLQFTSLGGTVTEVWLNVKDFENWAAADTANNATLLGPSKTFPMNPGGYTLIATGYIDDIEIDYTDPLGVAPAPLPTKPAGWWAGDVNVPGTPTAPFLYPVVTPQITLKGDAGVTGTGTFEWIITDGTTGVVSTAKMTIYGFDTDPPFTVIAGFNGIDLDPASWDKDTLTDSTDLPTGFYYLQFEFARDGSNPIYFHHVLQIYQNLTSRFDYELTDDYFIIKAVDVAVNLIFKPPTDPDFAPKISAARLLDPDDSTLVEGEYNVDYQVAEMTNAATDTITFTVDNATDFTDLKWYCYYYNGTTTPQRASGAITGGTFILGNAAPFVIISPPTPSITSGRYLVTVEGTVESPSDDPADSDYDYYGPFSTSFMVMVREP